MSIKSAILLLVISILLFANQRAMGTELSIPISNYAILSDSGMNPRLIVKFSIPDSLLSENVIYTEISFGITPRYGTDSIIQINCSTLRTDWLSTTATWNNPWTNPGGDYDTMTVPLMFVSTDAGSQRAYFDITEIARSWIKGSVQNYGLLFMTPSESYVGLTINPLVELPANAIALCKIVLK